MPPRQNLNSKLPGSSSSISLNESPTEETNYDSDISDDDNAIAEGDDEEEPDEGFELEVSTLTGNTFSVMIHPTDTLEVLKTRIAFQEGISPADQNLLLEQGKLLDTTNTIQELNIDHNSKLTLVTNVASGLPFKAFRDLNDPISSSSSSSKLAPTIRRNYHNIHDDSNRNLQSSSIRLPKILTSNNTNESASSQRGVGGINENSTLDRLDEREWMKSLFNKVVQNGNDDDDGSLADNINMDSTKTSAAAMGSVGKGNVRIGHNLIEEDGSILVVQGDDGVILIIQKNTGQLLDDYSFECNNYDGNNNNHGLDLEFCNGRIPQIGRYKSHLGNGAPTKSSYHSRRYYQDSKVHEKIKENAVTLEKMRQVRTLMAQKHQAQKPPQEPPAKPLEFPKISDSMSSMAGISDLRRDSSMSDNRSSTSGLAKDSRCSATTRAGKRSINSSKMSLNRLIAEIYLQSKGKGYAFQPGQPPYTQLQLLKYVQLKVAILLDEKRKGSTEPCTKCQLNEDWNFDATTPYLVPTVVINRYKRMTNVRNTQSLDKEMSIVENNSINNKLITRRSMIPGPVPMPKRYNNGYPTSGHPRLSERSVINQPDTNTNASSSRKSSSSTDPRRFSSSSSNAAFQKLCSVEENNNTENCDSRQYFDGTLQRASVSNRPSFRVYPRTSLSTNGKSSRPGTP